MKPFLTLARTVARAPSTCCLCGYPRVLYDAEYSVRIGGVVMWGLVWCSPDCVKKDERMHGRDVQVAYMAVAA